MDEALRQYQQDLLRANLTRRSFMTMAALGGTAAFLAACGSPSPTPTPINATAPTSSEAAAATITPSNAEIGTPPPSFELEDQFFLFNWTAYFSPDNKSKFTQDFKLQKFVEDTYPSNEELLTRLQAGAKGEYDVAVPTAEFVPTLVKDGFVQKLDKSRLPNLKYINPMFRGLPFDPHDDYIVPKDWGTTGIIYRGKDVTEPVVSWKDFFDLAETKYSGRTFVVDSPSDVFVAPLRLHGFDVNTTKSSELEIARRELMKLRPHLQSIDSDNYPQALRDEVAVLGLAWNGTAYLMQLEDASKDTGYTVPSEGTIIWLTAWVMLADAPNPNTAYAFLDWIQDPQVQVTESLYTGYASANDAARPLLPPEFVSNPAVYVPDAEASKLSISTDQSGNQQRADIWAEFKQG